MEKSIFESGKFRFNECVDYSADSIVSKRVLESPAGNVTLFAFDEGQRLSEHSAPYNAILQIVEGSGEVILNRIPYQLGTGETIIMPASIPHAVNAVEKFKMVLTMIKG